MSAWRWTLLAALAVTGCTKVPPRPAVSERQRDSVIGQSRLPGAAGVRGAMRAGDTAVARNSLRDSLAQEP